MDASIGCTWWIHPLVPCNGYKSWMHPPDAHVGYPHWFHPLESHVGCIHQMHMLDTGTGNSHWIHMDVRTGFTWIHMLDILLPGVIQPEGSRHSHMEVPGCSADLTDFPRHGSARSHGEQLNSQLNSQLNPIRNHPWYIECS